jgi:hypothetical protein
VVSEVVMCSKQALIECYREEVLQLVVYQIMVMLLELAYVGNKRAVFILSTLCSLTFSFISLQLLVVLERMLHPFPLTNGCRRV